jgi:hypothetical protein
MQGGKSSGGAPTDHSTEAERCHLAEHDDALLGPVLVTKFGPNSPLISRSLATGTLVTARRPQYGPVRAATLGMAAETIT